MCVGGGGGRRENFTSLFFLWLLRICIIFTTVITITIIVAVTSLLSFIFIININIIIIIRSICVVIFVNPSSEAKRAVEVGDRCTKWVIGSDYELVWYYISLVKVILLIFFNISRTRHCMNSAGAFCPAPGV